MKEKEFAHAASLDQLIKQSYTDRYISRMFVSVTFDVSADTYTIDTLVNDIFLEVIRNDASTLNDLALLMQEQIMKENVDKIYNEYLKSLMNDVSDTLNNAAGDDVNLSVAGQPKFELDRSFETDVKLYIERVYRDDFELYKDDFKTL